MFIVLGKVLLSSIVLLICCSCAGTAQCRFDRAVAVGTGTTSVQGVAVGSDGSVYVTGTFYDSTVIGSVVLRKRRGNNESFLARYSPDLELLWVVDLRGTREMPGVAVDNSGNVFVVGWGAGMIIDSTTTLNSAGHHDIFLAKYDTSGRFQWARNIGGVRVDNGIAVACDDDGGAIVTGSFTESFVLNGKEYVSWGRRDIVVAAFDSAGILWWVQTAGGPGDDFGNAVAVGPDGSAYVTGWFDEEAWFGEDSVGPTFGHGLYVMRIDAEGKYRWVHAPISSLSSEGHGIVVAPEGVVWAVGRFFDTLGNGDNNVISYGHSDAVLLRYDSSGQLHLIRHAGAASEDHGTSIAVSEDGSIYAAGYVDGSVTPALFGTLSISSRGVDPFIAHYDPDGTPECVMVGGGVRFDVGHGVAAGTNGMAYLVGVYSRQARFDTITLTGGDTASLGTGFIARARFEPSSSIDVPGSEDDRSVQVVQVHHGLFRIDGIEDVEADINVYDLLGREVHTVHVEAEGNTPISLDLGRLRSGMYIISVQSPGRFRSFKVLLN